MKSINDIWPLVEGRIEGFSAEALWDEITTNYPEHEVFAWVDEAAPRVWHGHETAGLKDIVTVAILSGISVGWELHKKKDE